MLKGIIGISDKIEKINNYPLLDHLCWHDKSQACCLAKLYKVDIVILLLGDATIQQLLLIGVRLAVRH
jgi:hypothetical protein